MTAHTINGFILKHIRAIEMVGVVMRIVSFTFERLLGDHRHLPFKRTAPLKAARPQRRRAGGSLSE